MAAARRAWQGRGAARGGFTLLVIACIFLAVAGPRLDVALRTSALRRAIAVAPSAARSVYGTIDLPGLDADLGGPPTASSIGRVGAVIGAKFRAASLPLAGGDWAGLMSPQVNVTAGLPPAIMSTQHPPTLHLDYRAGLDGYGYLTAGRMPSAARKEGAHGAFDVAVTAAAAARYRLHPGSRIVAGGLTLTVTGVIRSARAAAAFWSDDPELAAPRLTTPPHGAGDTPPPYWAAAVFIGGAEVPVVEQVLDPSSTTVSWDFPVNVGALTADGAAALNTTLARTLTVAGVVGGAAPVMLNSGLSQVLAVYATQDSSAGMVLRLLAVSLAVIGVVTVLLGAQALARRRETERVVLVARGASRWQVITGAARDAAAAALPGAAAGTVIAIAVIPGDGVALSWWLAGVTLIAALGCGPVLALRGYQRDPVRRVTAWRRIAAEAALTVASVAGLVLLRGGAGGVFTSLAPVLAAVPAAIVVTRGYPLAVAGLARLASRRRGAAVFTGLAGAARSAPGTVVPGFALVLALAVGAFGFLVLDAVNASMTSASWQQAGADVTVDTQLAFRMPSAATVSAVSAVPGVRSVALVSLISGSTGGAVLPVAVVQPAQYAALVAGTPLPPFPADALAAPGTGGALPGGALPSGTIPALVTPAGMTALSGIASIGGRTTLTMGLKPLAIEITGTIAPLAGVADVGGSTSVLGGGSVADQANAPALVLPAWALGPGADGAGPADGPGAVLATPNFLLVTGGDSAALLAVIHRELPGLPIDAITRRAAIYAALAQTPLAHDEYLAVVAATAAAAVLAALVLLIAIASAAPSRRATVTRLRVMGAPARKGRVVELAQTMPIVIATGLGGVACAWVLGPLVGPTLNLSAFTGTTATVPVAVRLAPLAAAVAGLIAAAVLALAVTGVAVTGPAAATAAGAPGEEPQ
jgi:putative ABC transport system permease protein